MISSMILLLLSGREEDLIHIRSQQLIMDFVFASCFPFQNVAQTLMFTGQNLNLSMPVAK